MGRKYRGQRSTRIEDIMESGMRVPCSHDGATDLGMLKVVLRWAQL